MHSDQPTQLYNAPRCPCTRDHPPVPSPSFVSSSVSWFDSASAEAAWSTLAMELTLVSSPASERVARVHSIKCQALFFFACSFRERTTCVTHLVWLGDVSQGHCRSMFIALGTLCSSQITLMRESAWTSRHIGSDHSMA